jgi:hypothetical protein
MVGGSRVGRGDDTQGDEKEQQQQQKTVTKRAHTHLHAVLFQIEFVLDGTPALVGAVDHIWSPLLPNFNRYGLTQVQALPVVR